MIQSRAAAWVLILLAGLFATQDETVAASAIGQALDCDHNTYAPNFLRAAQRALQAAGQDPGPVDGRWGRRTREALVTFQGTHDLTAHGEFDQETVDKLFGPEQDIKVVHIRLPARAPGESRAARRRIVMEALDQPEADVLVVKNLPGYSADEYRNRCGIGGDE